MTEELDIEALLEAPFLRKETFRQRESESKSKRFEQAQSSRSRERGRRRSQSRSRSRSRSRSKTRLNHFKTSRKDEKHRSRSPIGLDDRLPAPMLTEAQRDRRTVFCRQLAQRLEPRELKEFCEMGGKVRDVRIVYDKISRRSKGVAYVEFYDEESVPAAVALTGKKLLGIPIIVELTETEKNRIAEEAAQALRLEKLTQKTVTHLCVANLHPSITEADLKRIFQPFGDITAIQLVREEVGRSAATVQFRDGADATQACDKMVGFELAGRPIRLQLKEGSPLTSASVGQTHDYLEDGLEADGDHHPPTDALLRSARDTAALKTRASNRPSPCILLQHMYDPTGETTLTWDNEIAEEVREECSKFGKVEHVAVPRTVEGDVFIRFASIDPAQAAVTSLNGRWFGGKQIVALFIPQEDFLARYPKSP